MRKGMQVCTVAVLLMVMSGLSQAAELNIIPHKGMNGSLRDGAKVARGQIVCRGAHIGFYVWMNARQEGKGAGRYIVQGRRDSRHEIRVRLDGEGWSPVEEGQRGVLRLGMEEQAVFNVVADGDQYVPPDDYIFSVGGICINNAPQK
ncbi:adhesin [Escherichia coli]|nr:AfaD family invasin [Escherichia coli]ELL8642929.1 adhesin [Escherichia coli]